MDFSLPVQSTRARSSKPPTPTSLQSITVGSALLAIIQVTAPPTDLRGLYSDGIEYYRCCKDECDTFWAVQWNPHPRRKLVHDTLSVNAYKLVAAAKTCERCKKIGQETNGKLKKKEPKESKRPHEWSFAQANAGKKRARPQVGDEELSDGYSSTVSTACFMVQLSNFRQMQRRASTSTNAFEDVPLTPPPKIKENPATLAATDPSWDVVNDDDANEDWAVINHLGTAALQHRDAHVDTPTVRP